MGFRGKKIAKNDVLQKQHLLKPELGSLRQSLDSKRPQPIEVGSLTESSKGFLESPTVDSPAKVDYHLPAKFAVIDKNKA